MSLNSVPTEWTACDPTGATSYTHTYTGTWTQTSSPCRVFMTAFNPAVLGLQNVCVGVWRCQKWISPTRAALKHKGIFLRQVQRNKRDVLLRGFHATEKTGRGRREGREERRKGVCLLIQQQGTSSSEVVAIENGHAGIEGQLLYLITPAGGSDTVGFPQGKSCWESSRANDAFPSLTPVQSRVGCTTAE